MSDQLTEMLKPHFTFAKQSAAGLKGVNTVARRLTKISTRLTEDLEEVGTEAAVVSAEKAASRPSYDMNIIEDAEDFEKAALASMELMEKAAKGLEECLALLTESKSSLQVGIAAIEAKRAEASSPEVAKAIYKFSQLLEKN